MSRASAPVSRKAPLASWNGLLGIVAIGRNEGEKLQLCLDSLTPLGLPIVYVDSGSTDGSVERAAQSGAATWSLDPSLPFTAARARREGCDRLLMAAPDLRYLYFVDGDCETVDGWLSTAVAYLEAHADVAGVCGRRKERNPEATPFNLLCDLEWDSAVGPCEAMGGDAVYRVASYLEVGGFNPTVPAGEEPELCSRLRGRGWNLERLDASMTIHDVEMTTKGQWWRRQFRTGYGGWDVEQRFELGLFDTILQSAAFWGLAFPLATLATMLAAGFIRGGGAALLAALFGAAAWIGQTLRVARGIRRRGYKPSQSRMLAFLTMAGKLPIAWGAICARWDQRRGRGAKLIEYKQSKSLS